MQNYILKLSGEYLKGSHEAGLDPLQVEKLASEIKLVKESVEAGIGIVIGGGNFFRGRDAEKMNFSRVDLDYMGMMGTVMNSIALKNVLEKEGVKTALFSSLDLPDVMDPYDKERAQISMNRGDICIFAGGTGHPYFSTDTAALLKAVDLDCSLVLMGKNGTDGVYDSDPLLNSNAKKYDILTSRDVIEKKIKVMDLSAASIASTNGIDILVFDIDMKDSILRAIKGEKIGTLVKGE